MKISQKKNKNKKETLKGKKRGETLTAQVNPWAGFIRLPGGIPP